MTKRTVHLPDGPVEVEDVGDVDVTDVQLSDGTRLSQDVIDEVVHDATSTDEHRAQVEEAYQRRDRGRPPLSPEGSERITVTVTHTQNAALRSAAVIEHRSASEIVRDALDEYLERHAS